MNSQFPLCQDSPSVLIRDEMRPDLKGDFVNVELVADQVAQRADKSLVLHQHLGRLLLNDETTLDQTAEEGDVRRFHVWQRVLPITNGNRLT